MANQANLDDKLLAKYHHSTFSTGVRFIIALSFFERYSIGHTYHYIYEEFFVNCLKDKELATIHGRLKTYQSYVSGTVFLAAILADSYIDKWALLKFFATLGSLSSIFIVTIAFLNSSYSYSGSFDLKHSLFKAFLFFLAFSEMLPVFILGLLLDQIGLTSDFVVDTSNIFTIFKSSNELADLLNLCTYYFSKGDKLKSAYNLLFSTVLPNCICLILLLAHLRRLNLSCEPPQANSVLKAIFYVTYDTFTKVKKLFQKKPSSTRNTNSSNHAAVESKKFWSLVLITACFIPFYYLLIMIGRSGTPIYWPEYSKTTNEILKKVIMLTCLTFMQLGICPFLYRCGTMSTPTRRLTLCYLVVGGVAMASYCMMSTNQNLDPFEFIRLSNYSLVVHNLLPSPTSLVFEEQLVVWSVDLGPYSSHLLVNQIEPFVKLTVINEEYSIDDFHYAAIKDRDTYVITPFGLEEISVDSYDEDDAWIPLRIVCFKIVCKGDVFLDCDGDYRRSELSAFAQTVSIEVLYNSDCNMTVKVAGDPESSRLNFVADGEDDFIAVVDFVNGTKIVPIGRLQDPIFADWAFLPPKVIALVTELVFHIAYYQFVLLEAPVGVRTTIIACHFFAKDAAHLLGERYMMRDYLIDRHAAICAFTIYVVSFLIYAYAINKFHTAERIRELRRVVVAIDRLFSATERRRGTSISDQSQSVSLKNSSSEPTPHEPQVDSSRS